MLCLVLNVVIFMTAIVRNTFIREEFSGTGDGIPAFVQEFFELQDQFDIAMAVKPLFGIGALGVNRGEFAFPVAKDVGGIPVSLLTSPILK